MHSGFFSERVVAAPGGNVRYRQDSLFGFTCRISPEREKRVPVRGFIPESSGVSCPFCPENIMGATPSFADGKKLLIGESVTFPNLYPFSGSHIVTVITNSHNPVGLSVRQIIDALTGQYVALTGCGGYPSINWNNLPSSGASMVHPHMQGISDQSPSYVNRIFIGKSREFMSRHGCCYWDKLRESEADSERYISGDEILWCASPVPIGEKEIRGYLPFSSLPDFGSYISDISSGLKKIIDYYHSCGHFAFNATIRFDKEDNDGSFRSFVSVIARINPNEMSVSDSAFMERLHFEPVCMTLPEKIPSMFKGSDSGN
ncbi:galactose-1-phosphate uridylyltransferase [Methanoplanus endosymbiosus]|uniref:Galactose-1-phosphate uridylyltransferase n=1 Tax=Methanoplanus endosymbiosus TaxID=33865 RepID=A0A9E7PKS6_9EURY|nr:galactose-1-phosphate uridylyltransferase [Methanoplanus endosymbiosus]UUX91720.1 galactose-1-phosphate uridylyltransferase [Methanoplanus endosymbiosus]